MAGSYYLKITGQTQGLIKGDSVFKAHAGEIELEKIEWEALSPRDPHSGLPTGKRQMKPLVVKAKYSKASPKLQQAFSHNEGIKTAIISCMRPILATEGKGMGAGLAGGVKDYLTITLTNASISSYKVDTDTIEGHTGAQAAQELAEEVSFTFQKIEWTWLDGGITYADDWQQGV